jgi:hypothetical protein
MCDAAGYVWADHVLAAVPAAAWRRCDAAGGLIVNHPVLQVPGGEPLCPFELVYSCMLAVKDDMPARAGKPAGRDPEALALWADGWIGRARAAADGREVGAQAFSAGLSAEAASST